MKWDDEPRTMKSEIQMNEALNEQKMMKSETQMKEALKIGDTVRLKSGGPLMTINAIISDKGGKDIVFECLWFQDSAFTRTQCNAQALYRDTNAVKTERES
jgi:uncharacterized protein YodC (DUF2158 family)